MLASSMLASSKLEIVLLPVKSTASPGSATSAGGIAQGDRRAALHRDLFHFSIGEEADPLAVGRKERIGGAFGAGEQCSLGQVEESCGKLLLSIRAAHGKGQPRSVGRDGGGGTEARH